MWKLRKIRCLLVPVVITVGLSAQVSPVASDLPSNQQIIAFLTESIDWYRHCAIERQIATDPQSILRSSKTVAPVQHKLSSSRSILPELMRSFRRLHERIPRKGERRLRLARRTSRSLYS